ncbi:MAG: LysR family transcriptional regulator [Candidatus Heteroscillospira sp.]|jgi:DNA-binding transcriptional LysR family regulator
MNTKVYEYLTAIAEEKSITSAAERFYLSQPSMSKHLNKVEAEIGAKLFYRKGGELALTDAGKIYMNGAQAILRIERQAEAELKALRRAQRRALRIMCHPQYADILKDHILPKFTEEYRDFPIVLAESVSRDARAELLAGELDAAVLPCGRIPEEGLETRILKTEAVVFAAPPQNSGPAPDSSAGLECFLMHEPGTAERLIDDELLSSHKLTPALRCTVPDNITALKMVARGCGCACLPERLARSGEDEVALRPLPPEYRLYTAVLYRQGNPMALSAPAVRLFDMLKTELNM